MHHDSRPRACLARQITWKWAFLQVAWLWNRISRQGVGILWLSLLLLQVDGPAAPVHTALHWCCFWTQMSGLLAQVTPGWPTKHWNKQEPSNVYSIDVHKFRYIVYLPRYMWIEALALHCSGSLLKSPRMLELMQAEARWRTQVPEHSPPFSGSALAARWIGDWSRVLWWRMDDPRGNGTALPNVCPIILTPAVSLW